MKDYDGAKKYFNSNKEKFRSSIKQNEAQTILIDYQNRLGLSGLYRLYK